MNSSNFFSKIGIFLKKICLYLWKSLKSFFKSSSGKTILSSLISIAIGLIAGLIIMIIIASVNKDSDISDAFKGIKIIMQGPFSSKIKRYLINNTGDMIFYSVPLIMTGLSVAIAYKTGLFNIGAPGQFIMGTVGSLIVALSIKTETRFEGILVWILAICVGAICGGLWGTIPGLLKAFFNINEVIVCIMTNWISANLASWILKYMTAIHSTENTKGGYLAKNLSNYTPKFGLDKLFPGSYIDGGIIFAIIIAIIIFIILNKTRLGYSLKACGSNKNAAKYGGLNEKRNIILSMTIAGALSGLGACFYYLNPGIEYYYISQYASLPAYGFNGIASAFLANCNPIGTVFTSLFIRYINMGGEYLTKVGFNRYVADIIVAVIIYNAAFTMIIKELITKLFNKKRKSKENISNETNILNIENKIENRIGNRIRNLEEDENKIEQIAEELKEANNG